MLSYQHVYHAGNHADILKHSVLTLILEQLKQKSKPFTVFDTHAGEGFYYLDDVRSQKTQEYQNGLFPFLREIKKEEYEKTADLLKTYIDLASSYEKSGRYLGSPQLERLLMRKGDELILSELHPQAIQALRENMRENAGEPWKSASHGSEPGDSTPLVQPHIHHRNGYELLTSLTPPAIKRGMALIDPSFEDTQDFYDCSETLSKVHKKWPVGILALWYPILSRRETEIQTMKDELTHAAKSGPLQSSVLDLQLIVTKDEDLEGKSALLGSGMFIINAPYLLDEKMEGILKDLSVILGGEKGSYSVELL